MSLPLILLAFTACAAIIIVAGTVLARSGDVIAARTQLGGLWVGSIFLAIATSLPELTTDLSAVLMGLPDLAVGDLFGSSMANMLILAVISMMHRAELFRRAALDNTVAASLAIVLTSIAAVTTLLGPLGAIWGVGYGTLTIVLVYLAGTRAIYRHSVTAHVAGEVEEMSGEPAAGAEAAEGISLQGAIARFLAGSVVIFVVAPLFARLAERLAEATGLTTGFVGTVLVGLSTSLPELVTCLAAVRMGAYDLAVGNLFGSNAVNMTMLLPLDIAHRGGPLLAAVEPVHAVTALVAIALMAIGIAAIVYRTPRRITVLEPGSLLMVIAYIAGLVAVYQMGAGG